MIAQLLTLGMSGFYGLGPVLLGIALIGGLGMSFTWGMMLLSNGANLWWAIPVACIPLAICWFFGILGTLGMGVLTAAIYRAYSA
jgi:hypothetical protein